MFLKKWNGKAQKAYTIPFKNNFISTKQRPSTTFHFLRLLSKVEASCFGFAQHIAFHIGW